MHEFVKKNPKEKTYNDPELSQIIRESLASSRSYSYKNNFRQRFQFCDFKNFINF